MDEKLQKAVALYEKRQSRQAHPEGSMDNAGRWYPSDAERQSCCDRIRYPSRKYPWSLMRHCRSAEHVAHIIGVDVTELRSVTRQRAKERLVDPTSTISECTECGCRLPLTDSGLCAICFRQRLMMGVDKFQCTCCGAFMDDESQLTSDGLCASCESDLQEASEGVSGELLGRDRDLELV